MSGHDTDRAGKGMLASRPAARLLAVAAAIMCSAAGAGARLVPGRDPREGVFDAELVAIMRHVEADRFEITDHFLGNPKKGAVVRVPGFRLYTVQRHGPPMVEKLTAETRILMFLKCKRNPPNAWEVTCHGYCFFWVHGPAKIDRLRKRAADAIALRRSWEKARDQKDLAKRVSALWPFLWDHGVSCHQRTLAELEKTGSAAGDSIAARLPALPHGKRMSLLVESGRFGGKKLHTGVREHLVSLQKRYEEYVRTGPAGGPPIDEWNSLPSDIKEIWGELYYGLAGLARFKDRTDLPFIRDLALWAVANRLKQTCDAALSAFRDMPAKENLGVIDVIWAEFSRKQYKGNEMSPFDVTRCLRTHTYPETVPRLVKLLANPTAGQEARAFLKGIVGSDLGPKPEPWMQWYEARQRSTKSDQHRRVRPGAEGGRQ